MISDNQSICPKCGGQLKYYDHVQRLVRTKFGNKKWVAIRRLRCCKCHAVHRELPDFIFPYKQYEADIIIGVLEGLITCETLGFEDYPCEMTMVGPFYANLNNTASNSNSNNGAALSYP